MKYSPVVITVDLSNTTQSRPGFVKLSTHVSLPFDYISKYDIKAEPAGTSFRFVSDSVIEIIEEFDVSTLPQTIVVSRDTNVSSTPVIFYPGANIRSEDLNNSFKQLRYKLEELDA